MQLCDKDIYRAMIMGDLLIVGTNAKYPFIKETQVQPASIDLRLGNRIMRFRDDIESFDINNIKEISKELVTKELLDYDSEGWIGFNLEHDFLSRPPASFAFQKSPILFPGIGYNLTFVYKKGAGSDVN